MSEEHTSASGLEKSTGDSTSETQVNGIDFSKELDQLSYQRSDDGSVISPRSNIVNFAALYLEVARKGPAEALKMIGR